MFATDFSIPPEAIELYILRRSTDLEKLKAALHKSNASEFFKIGHCLKGNAVPYGFPELEILGKKLEEIAKTQDWNLAKDAIDEMQSWCLRQSKTQS